MQMIKDSRFRKDLYDRLAVEEIEVPALSERPGDLAFLAEIFMRQEAKRKGVVLERINDEVICLIVYSIGHHCHGWHHLWSEPTDKAGVLLI